MEETLCVSNWTLLHKKKGTERKLKLKPITMIYPVTGWFEITEYNDKIAISIET